MEVVPGELADAARRWAALATEVAEARARLRSVPTHGLGEAAGEAALLLVAADRALTRLEAEAERLVVGLLVTSRAVAAADDAVALRLGALR